MAGHWKLPPNTGPASASASASTSTSTALSAARAVGRYYVDNALNRHLNRVGLKLGSAPFTRTLHRARGNTDDSNRFDLDALLAYMRQHVDSTAPALTAANGDQAEQLAHATDYGAHRDGVQLPATPASTLPATASLIPWSDIQCGRIIGKGAFGVVFQAQWQGAPVAVKVLNDVLLRGRRAAAFEDDIRTLCRLQHPNIVRFLGVSKDDHDALAIVMELMPSKLLDVVAHEERRLTASDRRAIVRGLFNGLAYLHTRSPPVVHRDLKLANILVDPSAWSSAKLADFGLARSRAEAESSSTADRAAVGTPRYQAPELLPSWSDAAAFDGSDRADMAADVYAAALCVYAVYASEEPFDGLDCWRLSVQVRHGTLEPTQPDTMAATEWAYLRPCFDRQPAKRPFARDLVAWWATAASAAEVADASLCNAVAGVNIG